MTRPAAIPAPDVAHVVLAFVSLLLFPSRLGHVTCTILAYRHECLDQRTPHLLCCWSSGRFDLRLGLQRTNPRLLRLKPLKCFLHLLLSRHFSRCSRSSSSLSRFGRSPSPSRTNKAPLPLKMIVVLINIQAPMHDTRLQMFVRLRNVPIRVHLCLTKVSM